MLLEVTPISMADLRNCVSHIVPVGVLKLIVTAKRWAIFFISNINTVHYFSELAESLYSWD